jgi:hypothetical protein
MTTTTKTRKTRKTSPVPAELRVDYAERAAHEAFINNHFTNAWGRTEQDRLEAGSMTSISFRPVGQPFQVEVQIDRRIISYGTGRTYTRNSRMVRCTVDGHWTDTVECSAEFGDSVEPRVQTKVSSGGRLTPTANVSKKYAHCVPVQHDEDALENLSAAIAYIAPYARLCRDEIEVFKS